MMRTGILFDLDGTLLDTLADLHSSVNHALSVMGYPARTLEEVRLFVGNGARRLIAQAVPAGGDVEETLTRFREYYDAHCRVQTRPYDGILEALERVRERYPVAIVSNKPDIPVKSLCKDYFDDVYALGELPPLPRKPEPDMLYKAMKDIGVDSCIYVGDSEVDVITAKNAGVKCLSVTWGFRDQDCLTQAGGKYFCHEPKDLMKCLEEMM